MSTSTQTSAPTTTSLDEREYTAEACAIADAALGPHLDHLRTVSRSFEDSADDDVLQAVHEVMRRRTPKQYADDERLSDTLDDSYNEITSALKEAALIVGIQIGRTISGPSVSRRILSPASELNTDGPGATIGIRNGNAGALTSIEEALPKLRAARDLAHVLSCGAQHAVDREDVNEFVSCAASALASVEELLMDADSPLHNYSVINRNGETR